MTEEPQTGPSDRASADETDAGGETTINAIRGRFALIIIALMVLLADVTIYHAEGFLGPAVFLAGAVVLMFAGVPRRSFSPLTITLTAMTAIISWRLACNGGSMLIIAGLWLIHAMVLALRRETPYVLETLIFAARSIPGGYEFLSAINSQLHEKVLKPADEGKPMRWLNVGLPAISALLFGSIFVMANPDMLNWISGRLGQFFRWLGQFFDHFSPFELMFWGFVAWMTAGLLRPVVEAILKDESDSHATVWEPTETPLYTAFRNTLVTVITLFSVYLLFEFQTSWFRTFPEGFHYSGYAHQGAAWLTVALSLATLMLSLIFRGLTLCDPRLSNLHRLAWIWSGLNFVLAIAVYHRMMIYIDYNGMTRMRVVGLLGITSVVGGFMLVILKITGGRNFLWLIRRQLWVVATAAFVFIVLPVDSLVHGYNVRQILAGNPAPIVQITAHPIDDEALPVLLPLCELKNDRMRLGIQAMLTNRRTSLYLQEERNKSLGWTAWQKSSRDSLNALDGPHPTWQDFSSDSARDDAWRELSEFAFDHWW